ncbi:unnamed protein product [Protopolystoma xenopodis]|uniref:Uncharacterized protein n=1 Tax=Protopolystoma xenopodis TaxID=117903 RepID=A0A448WUA3_9PLAT|nr:unnamed protein product [Protopolystoma xenopodis]
MPEPFMIVPPKNMNRGGRGGGGRGGGGRGGRDGECVGPRDRVLNHYLPPSQYNPASSCFQSGMGRGGIPPPRMDRRVDEYHTSRGYTNVRGYSIMRQPYSTPRSYETPDSYRHFSSLSDRGASSRPSGLRHFDRGSSFNLSRPWQPQTKGHSFQERQQSDGKWKGNRYDQQNGGGSDRRY